MSACFSVFMSCSLLSCIKSVCKAGGMVRFILVRECYIHSFIHFQALLHNFHAIWAIINFCANFNMLGIIKNLLQLRNSLLVLVEAIGLSKGPKALKTDQRRPNKKIHWCTGRGRRLPKGAEMGMKAPKSPLCSSHKEKKHTFYRKK